MKKIIIAFAALPLLFACSSDHNTNPPWGDNVPETVQFGTLKDGELSGEAVESGYYVVQSAAQWTAFKDKINAAHPGTDEFEDVSVDLTVSDVIAVVDQQHNSGGYDITITGVTRMANTATVKLERTGEGNASTVMTQPYHVITVAKTNNVFVFDEDAPQ